MTKSYNLAEAIAEVRDQHPPFEIVLADGDPISIDPPELWPDTVVDLVVAENPVGAMKTLLGEDYQRFTSEGGTTILLLRLFQDAGGKRLGELLAS